MLFRSVILLLVLALLPLRLLLVLVLLLLLGMLLLLGVLLLSLLLVLVLLLLRLLLVLVLLLLLGMLLLLSLLLVLALLLLSLLLLLVLLCLLFGLGLLSLLRVGKSNAPEKHEQQKCCADNCQSFHKRASHFSLSLATLIDCLVLTSSGKDDHGAVAELRPALSVTYGEGAWLRPRVREESLRRKAYVRLIAANVLKARAHTVARAVFPRLQTTRIDFPSVYGSRDPLHAD